LKSSGQLFANFCWLLYEPANQNMETVKGEVLNCQIHHEISWEFQKSQPANGCNRWKVVAIWFPIWNGSRQKLSKSCQKL